MILAVDCHVHLYQFSDLAGLLAAAVANSRKACRNIAGMAWPADGRAVLPTLILAEPKGRDSFALMLELAATPENNVSGWRWRLGEDGLSVFAEGEDGATVLIISGQQVVTAERLEILAIACRQDYEDGQSFTDTMCAIGHAAFPVLPWGVGKWLGRRRRLLASFIGQSKPNDFALADTSSRPALWPEPLFAAGNHNLTILRGTDPLPLTGQVEKTGTFGSLVAIPFDPGRPAASLLASLRGGSLNTVSFGQPDSCRAFFNAQMALRWSRATG